MTCGLAVKRPHDYEAYLSPEAGVELKRPRPTHCSPFRPQLGTLAANLPQTSGPVEETDNSASPFSSVRSSSHLSSNQLEDYLRTEIRYLKRRKLIPRRAGEGPSTGPSPQDYRRGASSPSSSHSGSDSEGEQSASTRSPCSSVDIKKELYEKPAFSLNQVKLICDRLLKEQEMRLRHEYETVLNRKLDEKHQEYVQFAKEQLERHSPVDLSYLS
ncbi:unnamed protein product [Bursaphelenchus xylophilus]|uniref:(pine wood nematode) hypothetical protein n=1 Tax=Bursaphelenchus xylophilus TaxID=6326 RepID=A0A1I7S946_BURXY|nr:unnamed protein product [Bursaphelenchus xylophilus]CAG9086252.1 unnamed protein product [Bursaphelenchus xylophilus]